MVHVTVLGAAGGIGQPLSLLLKSCPYVSQLNLYDIRNVHGVRVDISHVNTNCPVESFEGHANIGDALRGAELVVIPAGMPRKPGMTRDDLFAANATIVRSIAVSISLYCPEARILVISNPVNSTVPIMVETLKKAGKFNPARVYGITTLDLVRAQTFLLDLVGRKEYPIASLAKDLTVVGGHSGTTIVPIFRNKKWLRLLTDRKQYDAYVKRVQFGGDEVVKAKNGGGSATLSMAVAGYHFAELIMKSIHRVPVKLTEPAYVYLPGLEGGKSVKEAIGAAAADQEQKQLVIDQIDYFAVPVTLKNGDIQSVDAAPLNNLEDQEKRLLQAAIPELFKNIRKGVDSVNKQKSPTAKL